MLWFSVLLSSEKKRNKPAKLKKKKEGKKKGLKGGRGERGEAEPPPPPNPCSAAQPLAARNAGPSHASDVHSPAGDSDIPRGVRLFFIS